jgi:VCBS repeat-containing protein
LTLNGTGSFTYTPAANYSGADSFTYRVTDDGSPPAQSNVATVSITVAASNDAPTAVNDTYNATEDTPLTEAAPGVLANDTDPEGNPLTAAVVASVTHGTLTLNANGSFTYTPAANYSGPDSFTYRASDGTAQSNVATVTITVAGDNDAPTATNDSYNATEDTPLTVGVPGVLANDTDPDGNALTAAVVATVTHGTLTLNANGSFTYTPAANYSGADSFTYRVTDDGSPPAQSNVATVSITVAASNDAPTAVNDSYNATEDTPLSVSAATGVLANDTDPDSATLTAALVSTTPNGTLVLNSDGSFTFTPLANFNGATSFTYRAVDNATPPAQSNVATVTITVAAVNDAPSAVNDSYNTPEDTPLVVTGAGVLANDTDDGPPPLTVALVANVTNGTLTLNPNGSFTYTPKPAFSGSDSFSYRSTDSGAPPLQSNVATVAITITNVEDPPTIDPIPSQVATENVPFTLNLTTFVKDEDTAAIGLIFGPDPANPLPAWLTLGANGALTGTPLAANVGDAVVRFTVRDGPAPRPSVNGSFNLSVLRAGRADLEISIAVSPNPVALNAPATWTFTIRNNAPTVDVGTVSLEAVFGGEVPLQVDPPASPGCTVTTAGSETRLTCTLTGVAGGGTTTVAATSRGGFPGDVFTRAKVSIPTPVPIDETPRNDTATAALSVAQRISAAPSQRIVGVTGVSAAAGDVSGDGFADLAIATGSNKGTIVLLSIVDPANANKRVLSETPLTLGLAPSTGVALADLDGDKDLDAVTAAGAGNAKQLFLNAGPASFTPTAIGAASEDGHAVATGDLNGDLLPDVVFANNGPSTVYMQGSGTSFTRTATLGTADSRGVVLVDLFGTPLPEIVLANASGDASIYRNTGGTFTLELTLPTGPTSSVAAADFNADGHMDLAFGRDTATAPAVPSNPVMLNTSASAGSFFQSASLGASPTAAVAIADFDIDGDADVLVVNTTGAHQIYANSGTGTFVLHPQQIAEPGAAAAAVALLGVDARVDAALVGQSATAVYYNDGAGNLGMGDTTPPTIQLRGQATVTVIVGEAYSDAGATATDTVDGDVTSRIAVENPVDAAVIGTYTVTYRVTDLSGNAAAPVTRTVRVQAREPTGGGGGGATGLEVALWLALAIVVARLQRGAGWIRRVQR